MRKHLWGVLLFFLLSAFPLAAQDLNNGNPFRMSIRAAGTVPHPVTNKAFRRSFTGIYMLAVNADYQVFKGIQVGLQYENSLWKTPDNKIPGLNTYAQSHHGGFRVGYDRVVGETAIAYVGVSASYGQMHFYGLSYKTDTARDPIQTRFKYRMIVPEAGVFFFTEGNFAIGLHVSWEFTSYDFNPYKLYLDQHKAYVASDLNGTVSTFDFGFILVYGFWHKK